MHHQLSPVGASAAEVTFAPAPAFFMLGSLEIQGPDRRSTVSAARSRVVMAMLLLERNNILSTERLVAAVWEDDPPVTCKGQIQICVSALRRQLADLGLPGVVETASPGYRLNVSEDLVDLCHFERAATRGLAAVGRGDFDEADRAMNSALAMWRGPALDGVASSIVQATAAGITERRLALFEKFVDIELLLGRASDVVGRVSDFIVEYPFQERLRALQMKVLYWSGRQAEALQVYRDARRVLVEELAIEPGRELRELEGAILRSDELHHRLRIDSARQPDRVATAGSTVAPTANEPTATVPHATEPSATVPHAAEPSGTVPHAAEPSVTVPHAAVPSAAVPHPAVPTDGARPAPTVSEQVMGREFELAWIVDAIESAGADGPRVVMVSGMPGVGKSVLAAEAGRRCAPLFDRGCVVLDLDHQEVSGEELTRRLVGALGPDRPTAAGSASPASTVMVVIDNVAHGQDLTALSDARAACVVFLVTCVRVPRPLIDATRVALTCLKPQASLELLATLIGNDRIQFEPASAIALIDQLGGHPAAIATVGRSLRRGAVSMNDLLDRWCGDAGHEPDDDAHALWRGFDHDHVLLDARTRALARRLALVPDVAFDAWVAAPLLDVSWPAAEESLRQLLAAHVVVADGPHRYRMHRITRRHLRRRLFVDETAERRDLAERRLLRCWVALLGDARRRAGQPPTPGVEPLEGWFAGPLLDELLAEPVRWLEDHRGALADVARRAAAIGAEDVCWRLSSQLVTDACGGSPTAVAPDTDDLVDLARAAALRAGDRRGEATMLHVAGVRSMALGEDDIAQVQLAAARRLFGELADDTALSLVDVALDELSARGATVYTRRFGA